jgi:hypothetical protein
MRSIYSKLIIVFLILVVAVLINFKYQNESEVIVPQPQVIQKVVIVKKVYIQVPSVKDSTKSDTITSIVIPKENPVPNYRMYYRARNLHRSGFIS